MSRCIIVENRNITKIKTAVDKVYRLLLNNCFAGRVYMALKEPEIRKLLEEMGQAKSSLLLASTIYCQYVSTSIMMLPV